MPIPFIPVIYYINMRFLCKGFLFYYKRRILKKSSDTLRHNPIKMPVKHKVISIESY